MLAIIGGSGLYTLGSEFELDEQVGRDTPYGNTSSDILVGDWAQHRVAFLPRHGPGHRVPPHRINYRANIWALREQGVQSVIAVNAVGGIAAHVPPRALVLPDQIVDYSSGRDSTFFDGEDGEVRHIDFSSPYSDSLRDEVVAAARELELPLIDGATYACTNGPRLETAAEIRRLRNDGCDIVGMTGMPEASLACELEIEYASLALVVNWAAGIEDAPIEMDAILVNMEHALRQAKPLLRAVLARVSR
jgi:5'-methylthioinosine phosphorylase